MINEIDLILEHCKGVVKREIPLLVLAPEYTKILLEYAERLEKLNKFLMERENKLQLIENMFKNEPVDLKELSKLVRGE